MYWICHRHFGSKMRRYRLHSHQRVLRTLSKNQESVTRVETTMPLSIGWKLYFWAGLQCFSNSCRFENCFLVSSTKGAVISEKFGTNRRTKLRLPQNERDSLLFFGSGNSLIAMIRSLPIVIPSAEITCPKYFTRFDPNCSLDGLSVNPTLRCALNMSSRSLTWWSHVAEGATKSSM